MRMKFLRSLHTKVFYSPVPRLKTLKLFHTEETKNLLYLVKTEENMKRK